MKEFKKNLRSLVLLLKNGFSLWRTLYFNFHYFPFQTAIRLPVILYKSVRFKRLKGQIIIDCPTIKTGMIHLGRETYGFQWKRDHTIWEQQGGTVILGKGVSIGQGTFIGLGKNAVLKMEQYAKLGGNDKIICGDSITIKENTLVAWDVQIIDTDFRATINTITKTKNCIKKSIVIGKNNWLCIGSTILKGSITPDYCIVAANCLINKDFSKDGQNIVIGMENNAKVISKYISWDCVSEF
jgi:carbonic anhydrase/acetyltransferase-like protein (isoleucine patch superfamily)